MNNEEGLISVREAARRLGIKENTVRAWMFSGRIGFVKIGRAVRLRPETIEDVIRQGTRPAKAGAK